MAKSESDSNLLGALAYLLGLITGIIMYLAKKDDAFVRFHAIQSILFSIAFFVLNIILTAALGVFALATLGLGIVLIPMLTGLYLLAVVLVWLLLMYKAYQEERYKLPLIGDMAEKYSTK